MSSHRRGRCISELTSATVTGLYRSAAECDADPHTVVVAAIGYVLARRRGATESIVATTGSDGDCRITVPVTAHQSVAVLVGRVRDALVAAVLGSSATGLEGSSRPPEAVALTLVSDHGATEETHLEHRLALTVDLRPTGASVHVHFDMDEFTPTAARRLGMHLAETLDAVCDPAREISDLPALSRDEIADIAIWNDTGAPLPVATLHELVLNAWDVDDHRTAVVDARGRWSRHFIRSAADRIADALIELGAQPSSLVAIMLTRGWEQVAAVLGVHLAGCGYVPVDPELPAHRRDDLLTRSGCVAAVVADTRFGLPLPAGVQQVGVDPGGRVVPDGTSGADRRPVAAPEDVAYVIYTSGSTGRPKGVVVEHRSAVNTVLDINRRFGIGPEDRVLAVSSLSFDLSVYDLFGILAAGGCVVMPEPAPLPDPAAWAALVRNEKVTVWNSVPALFDLLVATESAASIETFGSLRTALLSGDWIPLSLPDRARAVAPAARLVSLGGATEGAIWSIAHPIGTVDPTWTSIPYGRPLDNQTIHILDADGRPLPTGVVGEIVIGGTGVAAGYHDEPDLTAAQFVERPEAGSGQMYRTGDLGRRWNNGLVEFLGRRDTQVKVRGFRVELAEIEAALRSDRTIADCVVVAVGPRERRRLEAYVIPGTDTAPDPSAWSKRLRVLLPHYMVPGVLHARNAFPLTANGKVDRAALTATSEASSRPEEWSAPPPIDVRADLAAVWCEQLGLDEVCPDDDFFALGGDSIVAIRAVSALVERGLAITTADFLSHPTVDEQAALVDSAARSVESGSARPASARSVAEPIVPLSAAQHGMLLHQMLDRSVYREQYRYRFTGEVDVAAARAACEALVSRHDALRAAVADREDGRSTFVVADRAVLPFAVYDVCADADPEIAVDAIARAEWTAEIDLAVAPLCRVVLARTRAGDHQLVWTFLHLVLDGWSVDVLEREWAELYAAHIAGRSARLAPAPSLTPPARPDQVAARAFWTRYLDGVDGPTSLVGGGTGIRGGPEVPRTVEVRSSAEVASAIRHAVRSHGVTTSTLVVGAWSVVLMDALGGQDVVFGTTVAGRDSGIGTDAVGGFATTVPVRVRGPRPAPEHTAPWLLALQEQLMQRQRWEGTAPSDVQRWTLPDRRDPLYDHILVMAAPGSGGCAPAVGLRAARTAVIERPHHPLAVVVHPGEELSVRGHHDAARIGTPQAEALLEQFVTTVGDLARAVGSSQTSVPMPSGSTTSSARRQTLLALWREALDRPDLAEDDDVFEAGADSMHTITMVSLAHRAGVAVSPLQLLESPTVAELDRVLSVSGDDAGAPVDQIERDDVAGPLTPIQRWFFERDRRDPDHFNQSVLVETPPGTDEQALREALSTVVDRHPELRTPYRRDADGGWSRGMPVERSWEVLRVVSVPPVDTPVAADVCPPGDHRNGPGHDEVLALHGGLVHRSLSLADGRLFGALLVCDPHGPARLLLVAHHVAVDGVSWRILVSELEAECRARRGGRRHVPSPTTAYTAWADHLQRWARSAGGARATVEDWERQQWDAAAPLPEDGDLDLHEGAVATVSTTMNRTATVALRDLTRSVDVRMDEVIVGAVAHVLAGVTGTPAVRLDVERHGREPLFDDVDLTRTVGWFTSIAPVLVRTVGDADHDVVAARDALRAQRHRGIDFSAVRWIGRDDDRSRLAALPAPEAVVNYLGRYDIGGRADSFRTVPGPPELRDRSTADAPPHPLEVTARAVDDELEVRIDHQLCRYAPQTVRAWHRRLIRTLEDLAGTVGTAAEGRHATSPVGDEDLIDPEERRRADRALARRRALRAERQA